VGFLQGGVVWDTPESEDLAQFGPFFEQLDNTAVVQLEELPHDEDAEELVLSEILAGTDGGILGQRSLCRGQGFLGQGKG